MAMIDIYSSIKSGSVMWPLPLSTEIAIENGITAGRNGKGSIFVYPTGRKNSIGNSCAKRAQLNHYGVIGVNAASQSGKVLSYGERCSAIFATAYASEKFEQGIVSTTSDGDCKRHIGGTWTAAAQASGIIALVLSANPDLTYRDIMHIITMSAEVAPLADNDYTWYKNGRGFWVSNDFGFGLLNAENMVNLAKSWVKVPKLNICTGNAFMKSWTFEPGDGQVFKHAMSSCSGNDEVLFLEQIEITFNIEYQHRGMLQISLTSPKGTNAILLDYQPHDASVDGFKNWRIKSVHFWGEDPYGIWQLEINSQPIDFIIFKKKSKITGLVKSVSFTLYGTKNMPAHYYNKQRKYAAFRLPDGRTSVTNY